MKFAWKHVETRDFRASYHTHNFKMAALFRSERPWYMFKEKICTRYSQFFKKNLKVICALAGILIPASVVIHTPDNYAQQLCAVKTALRFFRRVSSLYVTLWPQRSKLFENFCRKICH